METSNLNTTGETENKPVTAFRFGNVSAAIFREPSKHGVMMNVSVRKSFVDKAGAWQHSNTLAQADLLPAALALTKCFEYIAAANQDHEE